MGYKEHALREFKYAGWIKKDGSYGDEMQQIMCEEVLELLDVFSKHGHSGSSAPYAVNLFKTLASFKPIGGIKCTNDEWNDTGHSYQNKRLSSVFKEKKDSDPYYLEAIVWQGERSGSAFTGKVDGITSRQFIKLPFVPKTFYVDVYDSKTDNFGHGEYHIKDRSQLVEVFKYYTKYNVKL